MRVRDKGLNHMDLKTPWLVDELLLVKILVTREQIVEKTRYMSICCPTVLVVLLQVI